MLKLWIKSSLFIVYFDFSKIDLKVIYLGGEFGSIYWIFFGDIIKFYVGLEFISLWELLFYIIEPNKL
jgi:hypothetical protein